MTNDRLLTAPIAGHAAEGSTFARPGLTAMANEELTRACALKAIA